MNELDPHNVFNKRVYIFLGVLVVAVLIYGIFLDKGTLEINASPAEIAVKIKNKSYTTPLTIKLREGNYKISVSQEGFKDQEANVQIKPFKNTKLYFDMIDNRIIEPTHFTIPDAVDQLPVETDHFRISWISDMNTLVIVPNIEYGNVNPQAFLQENWNKYSQYAYEALDWLESHGLGKDIRTKDSIEIEWWLKEFWPEGKSINY